MRSFLRVENLAAGSKYEKVIWRCSQKYEAQTRCATGHVDNDRLEQMLVEAVRQNLQSRKKLESEQVLLRAVDTSELELEAAGLVAQIDQAAAKLNELIARNARVAQDQDEYERQFNKAHKLHQDLLVQHGEVLAQIQDMNNQLAAFRYYQGQMGSLQVGGLKFSPYLCVTVLDSASVSADGIVTFKFRDGSTQAVAIK